MKYSCKLFLFFAVSMGRGNIIRRGISIFLLLVFFQQMGAGLFVHNLLHDKIQASQSQNKTQDAKEVSFSCSCIDDFLIPFVGEEETPVDRPFNLYTLSFTAITQNTYYTSLIFSSLRGPPAV